MKAQLNVQQQIGGWFMKKSLIALVAALALSTNVVFAANDDAKHQLDDQKKAAKEQYEQLKDQLRSQYQGAELEQKLEQAEKDYKDQARSLDQQKDSLDDGAAGVGAEVSAGDRSVGAGAGVSENGVNAGVSAR
jgi:septal ring factor EnvC (AmiA/AmiB activator)